jgi:phage tail-like protein
MNNMSKPRKNPFKNNRFRIELDGIQQAGFEEATIPDSTSDVIECREGNDAVLNARKQSGLIKHGNLVLKRGITNSMNLYNWHKMGIQGKIVIARKNIAVIIVDKEDNEAARWEFSNAWPTKYLAPNMNAKGNDVEIETLEITFESMQRIK